MTENNNLNFDRFAEYERQRQEKRLDCRIWFTLYSCMGLAGCTHSTGVLWDIFSGLRQQPLNLSGPLAPFDIYDFILLPSEMLLLLLWPKPKEECPIKGRLIQWESWYHRKSWVVALLLFIVGNIMQWFNDGHSLGVAETPMLRDVFTSTAILTRVMIVSTGYLIIYFCFRQKTCPEVSPLNDKCRTVLLLLIVFLFLIIPLLVRFIVAPHLPKILYF